ncbi:MAG TPA: cupin domain-containing protein [Acetobacteraceae bacterium]|nr:cupin domain-containing protein [Acetobacteraceae bacterium]
MSPDKLHLAAETVEAITFEIPGATGGPFRIQILNEDAARGVVTSIVHLPPGGRIPAHRHLAGAEMHFVLEGDLIEDGRTLGPGAFLTHAAGVAHGPHESRGGARVLTVQQWQSHDGAFDFHVVEDGAAPGGDGSPDAVPGAQSGAVASEGVPGMKQAEQALGKGYG